MSEGKKESVQKEYLAAMLKGISNHMLKMGVADSAECYAKGFAKLQSIGVGNKCTEAKKDANECKNRYRNVPAYDHTRVLLKTKNDKGTDYINANWITGFGKKKKYIASQGPVPDSIHDFWSMVWENKVTLIVKVTREVENGVLKCHRYWPDPEQHPPQSRACDMGQIEVEYESAVSGAAWITRKFTLRSKKDGEVRSLTQLSYEAWPDHGVPLTSREFLTFRRHVKTLEQVSDVSSAAIPFSQIPPCPTACAYMYHPFTVSRFDLRIFP
jgi:protein tyrosine phosphatase